MDPSFQHVYNVSINSVYFFFYGGREEMDYVLPQEPNAESIQTMWKVYICATAVY